MTVQRRLLFPFAFLALLSASLFIILKPIFASGSIVQTFYVPLPEAEMQTSFTVLYDGTGNEMNSIISIVATEDNTVVYYDHWEDGYETDLANPSQSTTLIWGDSNDGNGKPAGFATDAVNSDSVIAIEGTVDLPRNPAIFEFDARDKIGVTRPIAFTRAEYATSPGTVLAGAVEVYSTRDYGTRFEIPVGQNINANMMYEYVSLFVMAATDDTTVYIDTDGNGSADVTRVLNEGESYHVDGGVQSGAVITSTEPIQTHLLTGDIDAYYESRWFTMYPTDQWSDSYFSPVGTGADGDPAYIFVYNPDSNGGPISVTYKTLIGSGAFSVPAGGTYQYQMPANSGGHFETTDGKPFFAILTVGANPGVNNVHDWGLSLVPEGNLTTDLVVGWGPGTGDRSQNASPIWVTTNEDTTLYVDYDGDPTTGTGGTDPNGNMYDEVHTLSELESLRIYDNTDNDQTGMRLYSLNGALLSAAWGQDPATAQPGNPYLDMGTTVLPFPVPFVQKEAWLANDTSGNDEYNWGDTVGYTVTVNNKGFTALDQVVVLDYLPALLTYEAGSTQIDGVPAADDTVGSTLFPLDEAGLLVANVPANSQRIVSFRALIDTGATSIRNVVAISATGTILTDTVTIPVDTPSVTDCTLDFTNSGGTPVTLFQPNSPIYVTIDDNDFNTDSGAIQSLEVTVLNPTTGDYETITLVETNVNTGVYRNSTGLSSSTTAGQTALDGTLYARAGETITVSYTDPVYGDVCSDLAVIPVPTELKVLYLTDPGAELDRIDPVATSDTTTALSAPISSLATETVRDNFDSTSYSNNDGSQNWASSWVEVGDGVNGAANDGFAVLTTDCQSGTCLVVHPTSSWGADGDETLTREVNLASAQSATLTYDYDATSFFGGGTISLWVSSNGGGAWTQIASYNVNASQSGSESIDISSYMASNTQLQWRIDTVISGNTRIGIDNFEVSYTTASTTATTFTQAPVMASDFVLPTAGTITVTAYVVETTGSLPALPDVTATLSADATPFITMTNPSYAGGVLTWVGVIAADTTVATGESVRLNISSAESGVVFQVRHDSSTYPSKIDLPTTTIIDINSLEIYDAAYPAGDAIAEGSNGQTLYVRTTVSDPFGAYDITDVDMVLEEPCGGADIAVTLNDASVVASSGLTKTYEYTWPTTGCQGTYTVTMTANEGTEGITDTLADNVVLSFTDTGTSCLADFADSSYVAQSTYTPSDQVCIYVTELDKNVDDGAPDTITLTVNSTGGLSEVRTLTETGNDTGRFAYCYSGGTFSDGNVLSFSYTDVNDSSDVCTDTALVQAPVPAPIKQLYLVEPSNTLSRTSPASESDTTTATTALLDITSSSSPGIYLLSNTTITDDIVIGSGGSIVDLDVTVNMTHTWVSDLYVTLTHVDSGTTVVLIDPNSCSSNDVSVTLDDDAASSVASQCSGTPPAINGTFQPNGSLSDFNGESLQGTWRISASDGVSGDHGGLVSWSMTADTAAVFTQALPMQADFDMVGGGAVTVTTFVDLSSGSFAAPIDITATLRHNNTTFATLSNPTATNVGGSVYRLVFSGLLGSNTTVPAGEAISLELASAEPGAVFTLLYDSDTRESKIELPASTDTIIKVDSIAIYDAAYPGGSLTTEALDSDTVYIRTTVSDPFGAYDITSLDLQLTDTCGGSSTPTLTDANAVSTSGAIKIYEYAWSPPSCSGTHTILATANEGSEGISASSITTIDVTPMPTLALSKTRTSAAVAEIGDTVTFNIVITNTGSTNITSLPLTDNYPSCLAFASASPAETAVGGGSIFWSDLAPLNTSLSTSVAVSFTVASACTPATNTAVVGFAIDEHGNRVDPLYDSADVTTVGATIGDYIWNDADGEGDQDEVAAGLSGVVVQIQYPDGSTFTTTTDSNGWYEFADLRSGTYTVTVDTSTVPSGWVQSADPDATLDNAHVVTLAMGATDDTVDFGYRAGAPGVIGNRVWLDEDGDGVQDAGEDGIANVVVTLTPPAGVDLGNGPGVAITTTTGADGGYIFTDLPPGDYTVSVAAPTGMHLTGDPDATLNGSTTVSLSSGEESLDNDFGFNWVPSADTTTPSASTTGAIGDFIWLDANGDGVQDPNEIGLSGIDVTLYSDPDGDGVYDNAVAVVTTDATGHYIFDAIAPGAYVVMVDSSDLPGTVSTTPTGDPDGDGDNVTNPIVIGPGDVFVNADFGYEPTGGSTIGDTIWIDADGDGVVDGGEPGIPGVTVNLLDSSGNIIATATTDENGTYSFLGLPAGDYQVVVTDTDNVLGDLVPISNPSDDGGPLDNMGSVITVDGINPNLNQDFGYAPSGHSAGDGLIGDTVFIDTNGNGSLSDGEGVAGVTVTLIDASGNTMTTVTDANGNYYFGGLVSSATYTVTVDTSTLPNGGVGLTNSIDPDGLTPSQSVVNLGAAPGNIDLTHDFGYTMPSNANTISGTLWDDADADGTLDGSEATRFQGVTIVLRDSDGNIVATTITDASGNYSFTNLPDDTYTIDVVDTDNVLGGYWHSDGPNDGADNNSQVDAYTVTVSGGQTNTTGDFGYYKKLATIGNRVWFDTNNDGDQDAGELGINGVQVTLVITYPSGAVITMVTTTMTDSLGTSAGYYSFPNLLADEDFNGDGSGSEPTFSISVGSVDGYVTTVTNTGSDFLDSDEHTGVAAQPVQGVNTIPLTDTSTASASYDFGFASPNSIGDYIWYDTDGDGIQDAGEEGIANVTIGLYDSTCTTLMDTAQSNADGGYLFDGLTAGDYCIAVIDTYNVLDGMSPTSGPQVYTGSSITVSNGSTFTDADFGYRVEPGANAVIGNSIWYDADGDGLFDPDEVGIPGVVITVTDGANTYTTTTNATGNYLISVPPGTYSVIVDTNTLPPGLTQTWDYDESLDNQTSVTVASGEHFLDADFGYVEVSLGTIGNQVWHDTDYDGIFSGEDGIAGVTLELVHDVDGSGTWTSGDMIIATVTTDANGEYEFAGVPDDDYLVFVSDVNRMLMGHVPTLPGTPDTDNHSQTMPYAVTMTGGAAIVTADFGFTELVIFGGNTAAIGNQIWTDLNADGVYNAGSEPGIPGVVVELWQGGSIVMTTTTNSAGQYLFSSLAAGTYNLRVRDGYGVLTDYSSTVYGANQGQDGNNQMQPYSITLTNGELNLTGDFGYIYPREATAITLSAQQSSAPSGTLWVLASVTMLLAAATRRLGRKQD